MQIDIHPEVLKELEYLVELHQRHGAPNAQANVDDLVAFVLASMRVGRYSGYFRRNLSNMMNYISNLIL